MKFLSKKSIVGTVLSAIILGSVASGVWQYIIDPLVLKSSKAILNIATLGMESFKNDLYRQVAKGFHEGASSALYSQINGLVGIAAIIFSLNLAKRSKELIQRNSELLAFRRDSKNRSRRGEGAGYNTRASRADYKFKDRAVDEGCVCISRTCNHIFFSTIRYFEK